MEHGDENEFSLSDPTRLQLKNCMADSAVPIYRFMQQRQ